MATGIVELATRLVSEVDRVDKDGSTHKLELPDEVLTDLYREFAGHIPFSEIQNLLEAVRRLRDTAVLVPWDPPTPDDLDYYRTEWKRLKPLFLGYVAYVDRLSQERALAGDGGQRVVGPNPPPAQTFEPGVPGMTFDRRGRVVTVDGRQFHGVNQVAYKVLECLSKAEPDPMTRQQLIDKQLIDKETTSSDINGLFPPGFPIKIRGIWKGWQLVYEPASADAGGT
jgi:hypothetical protein